MAEAIRLDVFKFAAENNTNLIFTHVYANGEDDNRFVNKVKDTIKKYNGSIYFVRLTAPQDVLYARVGNESRKRFMKAHDRETLEWKLDGFDIEGCLIAENTLTINTSKQDARMSAKQIVEYFSID